MQRRLLDAALLERQHDALDFIFGEDEIAHDHRHALADIGEAEPAAEREAGFHRNTGHHHREVRARERELERAIGLRCAFAPEDRFDRGGRGKRRRSLGRGLGLLRGKRRGGGD